MRLEPTAGSSRGPSAVRKGTDHRPRAEETCLTKGDTRPPSSAGTASRETRDRGRVATSVSTWQQPMPPESAAARRRILSEVAAAVNSLGSRRVRVAVDGRTAAGKTSFAHELARTLAATGREVFRASLDDFKRPWAESHLYDRVSGDGYYRNAFDLHAIKRLLLDPSSPTGSGLVALCSIDPITQIDHAQTTVDIPEDGVLLVDGVFALRRELNEHWDLRIWLRIDPELSIARGVKRDEDLESSREAAEAVHRDRYLVAEQIYVREVDPEAAADMVIDNTDFANPAVLRR